MRFIFGISCMLLGVAMLACRVESSGDARELIDKAQPVSWVRTVDGWERPDSWYVEGVRRPGLHPLVVAAGQGMASVLALVAFGGRSEKRQGRE